MKMGIGWVLLMGLCGAAVFDASAEHEYAVLQLHGDPAAAVDASPLGHVLNSMGDVRTVTNHSVFGPGSWYFDGTGDEVRMEDSDVWNFGAEDFTLELWMRSDRANAPGLRERLLGQWETDAAGFTNTANWLAYQAGNTDGIDTRGYRGAAYDGRYFYFAPYSDGTNAHGRVLRYDSQGALNSTSSWAAYDASTTDGMDMRGFNSAVFDGRHVYFIPRVAGGRVLRYDTRSAFKAADSWMGFDVNGVGGLTNQGYVSGLYDGRYLYLTPLEDGGTRHGHVVRYDTRQPFQQAGSWSVYDADGTRGLHTVGYFGCVYDGRYAYFAPHFDGTGYHGRALRYDTRAPFASANAWEAYDAGNTGGLNCKGYAGGVFDGRYVYYVPLRDGADLTNRHARMLRYDTQGAFTNGGSWTAFDAGSIGGLNTKAYSGATFDGRFVYFAPYPDVASPHGYVLRYDTQGSFASAGSWQAMDAGNTGGLSTKGYFGAVTDGRHVYFVPCNDTAFHGRILRYDAGGGRGAFELSASGQEQYGGYGGAGFGITFRASVGEQGVTLSANQVMDSNVWHHVAVTRAGAVMRLFVDGEILASAEVGTNALVNSGAPMSIGRYPGAATGFAGYVDEVRILKGCARWTNSFVGALPGEPYPDAPVISGRLTGVADGQGMDGATVRAGTHSTVTTNGGYYTLRVPYAWSGSISAERFATTIEPAMRMIEELRADAADQDFVWRHPVPVVSGVSTSEVPSGGGATVTLSGVDFRMPWYATNWSHRQVVTIDRSQVLGVLTNYPMLVRRTVPEFRSTGNGGSVGQADGGDFLFTDASGTNKLAHEIEKYDPGTGELIAWVNVPLVQTNRDTGLFVYYGNAMAANQWNAAGTWNSNYKGVFHLNDPGPINETFTGTVVDSSKWALSGNYSVNNRLVMSTTTASWNYSFANGVVLYYGDFDVQFDYDASGWSKPSSDAFELGIQLYTPNSTYVYYFMHMFASTGARWYNSWQTETGAGWGSKSSGAPTSGKMRVIRTGSTLYSYYWSGSAWVGVGSYAGAHTADPLYMGLYVSNRSTSQAVPATYFDNFLVYYGERILDSTANGNHGASLWTSGAGGVFNSGRWFNGDNLYIEIKNSPSLENLQENSYSLQAWYKPNVHPNAQVNNTFAQGVVMKEGWHSGLQMASNRFEMVQWLTNDVGYAAQLGRVTTLGQFYSMVGVVDRPAGNCRVYVNGEGSGLAAWTPNLATREYGTEPWRIGIANPGAADWRYPANGVIDEVRLLATPLSESWVKTEYNNQSDPGTFCRWGPAEARASWSNAATRVLVGGIEAEVVSLSTTQIVIRISSTEAGMADVTVVSPDGASHTLAGTLAVMPCLSGRVTDARTGSPLSGVMIDLGAAGQVITGDGGSYTQYVELGWSGSLTPSLLDAEFTPASRSVVSATANLPGQDFAAMPGGSVITSLSPATIPSEGGAWIEVNGRGFLSGWFNEAWPYRKLIRVNRGQVSGELTNYPMLVSRTDPDLRSVEHGGRMGRGNGGDLLFTDATGTNKLAHEVESYDPTNGVLVAWVNVPLVGTNRSAEAYLYYGNSGSSNQWNAGATWNANYRGVWHLNDPDYSDTFAGTTLDTNKWITSGTVVQNNGLTLTSTDAYRSGSEVKARNLRLVGDFDLNVTFDASAWTTPPAEVHQVVLDIYTTTGAYCGYKVYFNHHPNGTRSFWTWQDETAGGFGNTTTTQRMGRLRMWRNGNLLNGIYWNGSSWVSLGTFSGARSGEPMGVRWYVYNGETYTAVKPTYISSFQLSYGGLVSDSTAFGNHGANISSVQTNGMAGAARRFDGNNSRIEIRNTASLQDLQEESYSLQAWYKPLMMPTVVGSGNNTDLQAILMKTGQHEGLAMSAGEIWSYHYLSNGAGASARMSQIPVVGQFYSIVGVVDRTAGQTRMCLNGQVGGGTNWTPNQAAREYGTTPWRIGIAGTNNAPTYRWPANGVIDEVRLVSGTLSEGWLATEYRNHSAPGDFFLVGVEERWADRDHAGVSRVEFNSQEVESEYVDTGLIRIRPLPGTGGVVVVVTGGDGRTSSVTTRYENLPSPVVSGKVTDETTGLGLAGCVLALEGLGSVTSGVDGVYARAVPYGWSGRVTASGSGYWFRVAERVYGDVQENQLNQDWIAVPEVLPSGRDLEFYARYLKGNGTLTNYTIQTMYATIPVEFINVQGSTNVMGTWNPGSATADQRMLMVRVEGDLTVGAGATIIPSARKRGMVLFAEGNVNVLGRVSMTARGAANVAGDRLSLVASPSVEIPASGAGGGAAVAGDNKAGSAGGAGAGGATGGGGAGGANNNSYASWPTSGAGAAGTSYSGGSGGGGAGSTSSGTAGSGGANGGAGGNGFLRGGGGAGNPIGTGGSSTAAGTGGLLVLYAGGNLTIGSAGLIDANGSRGGDGDASSSPNVSAGGGGSGGGSINLFYQGSYANAGSGNVQANGGAGGTLAEGGAVGGSGGAGSVRTLEYTTSRQVSGRVVSGVSGAGISGVTITAAPSGGTTATTNGGYFTITLPFGWSGTLSASLAGGGCSPTSRLVGALSANMANQDFTWSPAPVISGVSPASGPVAGGTAVFITGTNFSASPLPTVRFGDRVATGVMRLSDTQLQALAPSNPAGRVVVSVTDPSGLTGMRTNGYLYLSPAPVLTEILPDQGSTTGGYGVQISFSGGELWAYRRKIALSPATSVTGQQVRVTLTTATFDYAQARAGGADIRFYQPDGTPLPHWVESWNASGTSYIWVRVWDVGISTLHLNYGHPTAPNLSSGEATFNFFDDFLGTTLDASKWSWDAPGGAVTVGGGQVLLDTGSDQGNAWIMASAPLPMRVETRMYVHNTYDSANLMRLRVLGSACPGDLGIFDFSGTYTTPQVFWLSSWTGVAVPMNTFIRLRTARLTNSVIWQLFSDADNPLYSNTYTPSGSPAPLHFSVGDSATSGYGKLALDWIYARKYVATEPAASVGARESSVLFGGVSANSVTVLSPTSVVAVAPGHGAGLVSVTLVNGEGVSNSVAGAFRYTPIISGRVTNSLTGEGIDGVQIELSGGGGSGTTTGGGYYTLAVSTGWSGTVTAGMAAGSGTGVFSPTNRSYGPITDSQVNQHYGFMPDAPVISGRVMNQDTEAGEDGVTVVFSNGGGGTVTTNGGYYSRAVPYAWSGAVTFSYTTSRGPGAFIPSTRSYTNVRLNQAGQDYVFDPPYFPGTRYVSLTGLDQWPYTNWSMAAHNIQQAVNAAGPEDTVLVGDGTYNLDARLTITKQVTVRSVNGPGLTTIQRGTAAAIGVAYLDGAGAVLDGFTVRNGYICCNDGSSTAGGVYARRGAVVQNCVIRDNFGGVYLGAGGLYLTRATAINCLIINNSASGISVYNACGGAKMSFDSVMINCVISGNSGISGQAGLAMDGHGSTDMGTCWVRNSIIQGNSGYDVTVGDGALIMQNSAYGSVRGYGLTLENCLASPALFVNAGGGDYRLEERSLLIDRGVSAYNPLATDLAGAARVSGSAIDIGVCEYQNARPRLVGRVTHMDSGAGMPGITVTTTGGNVTTDSDGYYSRVLEAGWSGTVTPTAGTGSFSPASRSVGPMAGDVVADFSWVGPPPVITGRITQQNTGAGVDGVTLTFSNGGGSVITTNGGYYGLQVARNWSGTVTPLHGSGSFSPAIRSYANQVGDLGGQDYAWVPPNRSIGGRVTHAYTGEGVEGLIVSLTNGGGSAVTTNGGFYSMWVPLNWSGRVTVSPGALASVSPAYRDYANVTTNILEQNAVWTPANPVLSGRVRHAYLSSGVSGVTVSLSNGWGSTTTSSSGDFSLAVPWNWSGTATYGFSSGSLSPATRSYANVCSALAGQDSAWYPTPRTVSGVITHQETGGGIGGVTLTISTGGSVVSAANGSWSYTAYNGWSGTVTPVLSGGTMAPASRSYANLGADQGEQTFAWGPDKSISGRVTNQFSGVGLDGIVLSFGGSGNATTTGGGYYVKTVKYGWSGTVSLSGPEGSQFTPASRSYSATTASQAGQDYGWQAPCSLSGRVTDPFSGAGVDGVTISLSNGGGSTTTAGGGYWSKLLPLGWSGTITPSGMSGLAPASRTVGNMTTDVGGQDFTRTGPAPVLSGKVLMQQNGAGQSGFAVQFSDGVTVTSAVGGTFSRTLSHGWSGTVSVSSPWGGSVSPAQRSYAEMYSDLSAQNFTWTAPSLTVSGRVSHQATGGGVAGAQVTFSGIGTALTGADGSYTQWVYRGWSGTVTSIAGDDGVMTPSARSYTSITQALSGQDFTLLPHRELTGRIVDEIGNGLDGVTVNGGTQVVANGRSSDGGFFSVTVADGWSGTLTPTGSVAGTFMPGSRSYANVTTSLGGQHFTVMAYRVISGRITDAQTGAGIDGVPVSGTGVQSSGLTAGGGYFTVRVRYGWSGTLQATLSGGVFTPEQHVMGAVTTNQEHRDYVWQARRTISGVVTNVYTGEGIPGVTISFPGVGSVVSGSGGAYSVSVPRGWNGTVQPSYASAGTFAPGERVYPEVQENQAHQNYSWSPAAVATLSGQVLDGLMEAGLDGVTIAFSGGLSPVLTSGGGNWSKVVPVSWTGTITPSFGRPGTFVPSSRTLGAVSSDVGGLTNVWTPAFVGGNRYVSPSGGHVYPFTNWAGAARDVRVAVRAAAVGETVWVTNGVYDLTATLPITNALRVYSVNGPEFTTLRYAGSPTGTVLAVSHANAVVKGFRLREGSVGGVQLTRGYLANCIVEDNEGTGVTLGDSVAARLGNVVVVRNTGRGIDGAGSVVNATVADNGAAPQIRASVVYNCVVAGAIDSPVIGYTRASVAYAGTGNQTGAPQFADSAGGDYRLATNSPAINAGHNGYNTLTTDIEGRPRIIHTIDMGAYEQGPARGLGLALADEPDPVPHGDMLSWLVTVMNAGPDEADNVIVTLTPPPGLPLWSNSVGAAFASNTWTIGTLGVGGMAEMRMWARPSTGGWLTNAAHVTAANMIPDSGYGSATSVTEVLGPVLITNVVAATLADESSVEWDSVVGMGYDVYSADTPFAGDLPWNQRASMVASEEIRSFIDRDSSSSSVTMRYYQVTYTSHRPTVTNVWALVRRDVRPHTFTMIAPPVRTDRKFNGSLGEALAETLTGDAGGQGDRVHILTGAGGEWRTLYLGADKRWREMSGEVSSYTLAPGAGMFVERRAPTPTRITFTGAVGNDGTQTARLEPGWNLLGLSEGKYLPLGSAFAGADLKSGASEELADLIVMQNGDGSWRHLMYVNGWGAPYDGHWFDLGTFQMVRTNEFVEPGQALYYLRRNPQGVNLTY